ncbi:MAG: hypothetical protein H7A25_22520 [Leptospiraceae bacterium]|nr:hypothetical protein [Leptospiraceae bacterium]
MREYFIILTLSTVLFLGSEINAEVDYCKELEYCYIVFKDSEYHSKIGNRVMHSGGLDLGHDPDHPEYVIIAHLYQKHSFILPGDKVYRIDKCEMQFDRESLRRTCFKTNKDEHTYSRLYYLFAAPLDEMVKHIKEVEVERDGKRIIFKTEAENRNILRKIFFFWEWGDYF